MPEIVKKLNDRLDFRLNEEDKAEFMAKCEQFQCSHQSLIRELVQAVNAGTLKIKLPKNEPNAKQEIYDVN